MSCLHTTGPRPGISFGEAWHALDVADMEAVVVDGPTRKLRIGDLQVQLRRGEISPGAVGALLAAAGFRLPAVCRCGHPPTDHDSSCVHVACGCAAFRPAS